MINFGVHFLRLYLVSYLSLNLFLTSANAFTQSVSNENWVMNLSLL